jgi:hypothetical protein
MSPALHEGGDVVCEAQMGRGESYSRLRPSFLPLFTRVRGRRLLGSPYAGSCITPPLSGRKKMTSCPTRVPEGRSQHP